MPTNEKGERKGKTRKKPMLPIEREKRSTSKPMRREPTPYFCSISPIPPAAEPSTRAMDLPKAHFWSKWSCSRPRFPSPASNKASADQWAPPDRRKSKGGSQ